MPLNIPANAGWVTTGTTATTITWSVDQTWASWTSNYSYTPTASQVTIIPPEDDWARARDAERRRVAERRRLAERDRARETAEERARELLGLVLTGDEWARHSLTENERPWFRGSDGYMYHLREGLMGNVVQYHSGADVPNRDLRVLRLCAHPEDRSGMPVEDYYVGQVLALKANAPEFMSHGNINEVYDGDEFTKQVEVWEEFRERRRAARRAQMDELRRGMAAA